MWCTQNFALIANGKIKNIVVCDDYDIANKISQHTYGQNAIAVDVSQYNLQASDTYENGKFYRNGEEIKANETVEDRLIKLRASATDLEEAACDITESYEERIVAIEEALCELSELLTKGE